MADKNVAVVGSVNPVFNAEAFAANIATQVAEAQLTRAALVAQVGVLNTQIDDIDSILELHSGKKSRNRKTSSPRTRDILGAEGRVLEALSGLEKNVTSSAGDIAIVMVSNGYPDSDSLRTSVSGRLGKLLKAEFVASTNRGQYSITSNGRKELKRIQSEATATVAVAA